MIYNFGRGTSYIRFYGKEHMYVLFLGPSAAKNFKLSREAFSFYRKFGRVGANFLDFKACSALFNRFNVIFNGVMVHFLNS